MNRIVVIGAGYVGLATAISLARKSNYVTLVESDKNKYSLLKDGISPINESGINEMLSDSLKSENLVVLNSIKDGYFDLAYICVGTPTTSSGDLNTEYIIEALKTVSVFKDLKAVIIKSTINLGDSESFSRVFPQLNLIFSPEFLREGTAVGDAMNPERLIFGYQNLNKRSNELVEYIESVYREGLGDSAVDGCMRLHIDARSAELIKLAANSYLALRLSYFNELSKLCENAGANIDSVRLGICSDSRIGFSYSVPSIGYAGPCLPKDTRSLSKYARNLDAPMLTLEGAMKSNDNMYKYHKEKIEDLIYAINKSVNVLFLGVAFKSFSDDLRSSLTLKLMEELTSEMRLVEFTAFDPRAGYSTTEEDILSQEWDLVIVSSSEYVHYLDEKPELFHLVYDLKGVIKNRDNDKLEVEYLGK